MTKDYYFGVLNSGLVKIYRNNEQLLGLDSLFYKRFKKMKFDIKNTKNLIDFVID
jgi:hypothetical protein